MRLVGGVTLIAGLIALVSCARPGRAVVATECFALAYGEWADVSPRWGAPVVPTVVRLAGHVRGASPARGVLSGYSTDLEWARVATQYRPRFTGWRALTADSLDATFGTGFGKLVFRFVYNDNGLQGDVRAVSDNAGEPSPVTSVKGRPVPCPPDTSR